jgi:hypothetical protein
MITYILIGWATLGFITIAWLNYEAEKPLE